MFAEMETVLNNLRTSMAEETGEEMSTVTNDVFVDVLRPAQEDELFQCYIKRDRTWKTTTYTLWLCLPVSGMEGIFLLVARKVRRATSTDYIISSDADDALLKESGVNVVGKLRSNILGTNFTIYENQLLHHKGAKSSNHGRSVTSTEVSRGVQTRNFKVGQVAYERPGLNVLRPMRCTLRTIPASTIDAEGFASAVPTEISPTRIDVNESLCSSGLRRCLQSKSAVSDCCATDFERPKVLKSKAPQWDDKLQAWYLNFGGRVTTASVKNFQLVAATEPNQICSRTGYHGAIEPNKVCSNGSKVLLQFGKIGKDMFTMDYRYPFSAFQAFAICLSSFDRKWL